MYSYCERDPRSDLQITKLVAFFYFIYIFQVIILFHLFLEKKSKYKIMAYQATCDLPAVFLLSFPSSHLSRQSLAKLAFQLDESVNLCPIQNLCAYSL